MAHRWTAFHANGVADHVTVGTRHGLGVARIYSWALHFSPVSVGNHVDLPEPAEFVPTTFDSLALGCRQESLGYYASLALP